ncbi:putative guanine nucleotide-binding protein alpha-4 subunit [Lyophyllum shimeji]|uniref:Guanine nucleotide-binding protein alpha-4 subunit n=1 Tax=Lyophyllum shimeji TaxID=47721 RepID=A0A9P3UJU2_LYOSH|nr:putative guanine nucleotide-binding protein alpha-4 subunit [Lyophyllum shimeji]
MVGKGRRQSLLHAQDDDPLTKAMAPPPNETEAEREARLAAEREAQKRSDAIDEELNRQRINEKKSKCVKILLLGQSESGKSTTLKNFQLFHSPRAFQTERLSWRAVVQLNVVRSIRIILDAMAEAQTTSDPASRYPTLTPEHLRLKMRLSPLQQVEEALLRKLTPAGSYEFEATHLSPVTNLPYSPRAGNASGELQLNSLTPWKAAFNRLMTSTTRNSVEGQDVDFNDPKDPGVILHACKDDIATLWNDPVIKKLLDMQRLRVQDLGGFFLDQLDRVTSPKYMPTDDDILRARLKTIGVSEHRFTLKAGNMVSHDWRVYDVGGARSLVRLPAFYDEPVPILRFPSSAAWVPYFDNMDAIIFLAPISCFDQVLAEDSSVNRLEDSILLWKSVVSNPLLKSTNIVLFLNKIDILKTKLAAGVAFGSYVVSYGDRPNDFESISRYLMKKFAGILKQSSPEPRMFYCHLTTVTDSRSTSKILTNVKDMLIRQNLEDGNLL